MTPTRFDPFRLPALARWRERNGDGFSILDFLAITVDLAAATAIGELLWPRFIVVEGCTLFEEKYEPANFATWWQHLSGDRRAIESVINHVHLWDLFSRENDADIEEALRGLASLMAQTWRCALTSAFPGQEFTISVDDEPDDYGTTITFWTGS